MNDYTLSAAEWERTKILFERTHVLEDAMKDWSMMIDKVFDDTGHIIDFEYQIKRILEKALEKI